MRRTISSLSFGMVLHMLGMQQLSYLFDVTQCALRCVIALLSLWYLKIAGL